MCPYALRVTSADNSICFPVLDEDAYKNLSKWMVSEFPEPATPNMMGTTSMRLLQRFSSSLLSVECPSVDDSPPDLRVFWRKVEFSFDVLKELEKSAKSILPSRNTSIAGRKKSRTVVKVRRIDPLPFDSMGISVPTTDVEVLDVYVEVLSQLQNILEVRGLVAGAPRVELTSSQNYLLVLRKSLISKIFKSSIFGSTCVKANLSSEVEMVSMGKAIGTDQYGGPVFSVIQPMMAVLYSGDVEGFGEWSILLSTNGEKTRIGDNDFRICLLEEKTRSHCPF